MRQARSSSCAAASTTTPWARTRKGAKSKGVIHFLSCEHALPAEIRLYDRLFTVPEPDADKDVDFCTYLNPDSLTVVQGWVESCVKRCRARNALPV